MRNLWVRTYQTGNRIGLAAGTTLQAPLAMIQPLLRSQFE